jgi:hypothetical protein
MVEVISPLVSLTRLGQIHCVELDRCGEPYEGNRSNGKEWEADVPNDPNFVVYQSEP